MAKRRGMEDLPPTSRVVEVIERLGEGASVLSMTSYAADEWRQEEVDGGDENPARHLVVEKLLSSEANVLGETRYSIDPRLWEDVLLDRRGHYTNARCVMNFLDDCDIGMQACYQEVGGSPDEDEWREFCTWRASVARRARLSALLRFVQLVVKLKLFAMRFRARVHSPGAPLYAQSKKRFRACQ